MKAVGFDGRYTIPPLPISDLDGFERYIVQEVLAHRRIRRGLSTGTPHGSQGRIRSDVSV